MAEKVDSQDQVFLALRKFSTQVTRKLTSLARGQPEDQLRSPLEVFLEEIGRVVGREVLAKGESPIERLGRPDYAVLVGDLLAGYIELKEPGKGANPANYTGHDKKQWE